jgi:hypothetical protein
MCIGKLKEDFDTYCVVFDKFSLSVIVFLLHVQALLAYCTSIPLDMATSKPENYNF